MIVIINPDTDLSEKQKQAIIDEYNYNSEMVELYEEDDHNENLHWWHMAKIHTLEWLFGDKLFKQEE